MKRYLSTFCLAALISSVGLHSMNTQTWAAGIEERKGAIVEPTPPAPPAPDVKSSGEVVMLGTTPMPPEVIQKLDAAQIADILERQASAPKSTAEIVFNEEFLVPGIVFASLTAISFLILYFSFRKRRETLETVRAAIQSGQTLPASFLEALESKSKPTPDSDLRKAVLLIAVGLSGVFVLASLADEEASRAWSIGLVPTLLGVGYLFLWRQSLKRNKNGSTDDAR